MTRDRSVWCIRWLCAACLLGPLACQSGGGAKVSHPQGPATGHSAEEAYWSDPSKLIQPLEPKPSGPLEVRGLRTFTLDNGLRVMVLVDEMLPLATAQIIVAAGSIDDPVGKAGLAEFTAQMLRYGTKRSTADEISARIDSKGATLAVGSDYEESQLSCDARRRALPVCLQTLAELLLMPTFPLKEMGEVRTKLAAEVRASRDRPHVLAALHFRNRLYGDGHPAGRPLTMATLNSITRSDLLAFHRRHYTPKETILVVSGAVAPAWLERQANRTLGRWRGEQRPKREIEPVTQPKEGFHLVLVDKPDLSQSFIHLGHAGIPRGAADRAAVIAMNYTLGGGGFSSRLMSVVRAEGGKTYGIRSKFSMATADGSFSVATFTRTEETVEMLRLIRQELRRIGETPPTLVELKEAKGNIAGGYAIQFKTAAGLGNALAAAELRGLPRTFVTHFASRIESLDLGEVAQAAKAHIHPNRLVVAIVGPGDAVAPLLKEAKLPFERVSFLAPIGGDNRPSE